MSKGQWFRSNRKWCKSKGQCSKSRGNDRSLRSNDNRSSNDNKKSNRQWSKCFLLSQLHCHSPSWPPEPTIATVLIISRYFPATGGYSTSVSYWFTRSIASFCHIPSLYSVSIAIAPLCLLDFLLFVSSVFLDFCLFTSTVTFILLSWIFLLCFFNKIRKWVLHVLLLRVHHTYREHAQHSTVKKSPKLNFFVLITAVLWLA